MNNKSTDGILHNLPRLGVWELLLGILLILLLVYLSQRNDWLQSSPDGSNLVGQYRELAQTDGIMQASLLRTLHASMKNVQGELLWDKERQQGMLHILRLPALAVNQFYELWVYDARSRVNRPVSTAVIRQGEENALYLSLVAESEVLEPYKFVLTLEQEKDIVPEQILMVAQP